MMLYIEFVSSYIYFLRNEVDFYAFFCRRY